MWVLLAPGGRLVEVGVAEPFGVGWKGPAMNAVAVGMRAGR